MGRHFAHPLLDHCAEARLPGGVLRHLGPLPQRLLEDPRVGRVDQLRRSGEALAHTFEIGGAARWLRIGPLPQMHPAELGKLALIVYLARWLAAHGTRIGSFREGLIPYLAIAGVAVLNFARGGGGGQTSLAGNALVLGAVFFEASYVILSKRLTTTLSAMRISAFANAYAAAVVLPFGLWELGRVQWSAMGPGLWLAIVWYALAASVFSFWCWMKGIAHLPANRAGVFTAVLPVAAAITAVVGLGEHLGFAHLVAFGCVALGIWVAARAPVQRG